MDQEESVVRKLAATKGINYPIIMGNDAIIQGFWWRVYGIPTTFPGKSKRHRRKKI
ncbi:MAG: hypothetical protein JKP90_11960 [Desulfofustis sp. PB-SRB1]|nr:hypothetical protein [Desulfofustis sp. PB-SRB1]